MNKESCCLGVDLPQQEQSYCLNNKKEDIVSLLAQMKKKDNETKERPKVSPVRNVKKSSLTPKQQYLRSLRRYRR